MSFLLNVLNGACDYFFITNKYLINKLHNRLKYKKITTSEFKICYYLFN